VEPPTANPWATGAPASIPYDVAEPADPAVALYIAVEPPVSTEKTGRPVFATPMLAGVPAKAGGVRTMAGPMVSADTSPTWLPAPSMK
jgi:hypothetical protein